MSFAFYKLTLKLNLDCFIRIMPSDRPMCDLIKHGVAVESLETLFRLETVPRHYFYCHGLGLEYTVLVPCLVKTFIKTVGNNASCAHAILSKVVILS